ncbi:hypothetical protein ILP97_04995 [Amycolatopsis sp. H6(2020)]|nr:hypothetical protein [Amycolatopsis sp. H6(2020)]
MKVMKGNFAYFFGHLMTAIGAYEPGLDALRAVPARLVVGVGEKAFAARLREVLEGR